MPADADDFAADILAVPPPLFIDRNVAFTRNLPVVESAMFKESRNRFVMPLSRRALLYRTRF
jgi:hypothetical protein